MFQVPECSLPPQKLPLEVLENVVEAVGLDFDSEQLGPPSRLETLLSCVLVCRDWVPKSRIYIYRVIRLDSKRRANGFMTTVATFPQLGEYVQELQFNLDGKHEDWIYRAHQILPSFLPNLDRLEYFHLPILHDLFFPLSTRFKNVTSLELYSLQSWSFRDIVRLLNGFSKLQMLEIHGKWTSPGFFFCRPQAEQTLPPATLRTYCSGMAQDHADDVVHWLARRQPHCPLDRFLLDCDKLSVRSHYMCEVLRRLSATLETLDLSLSPIGREERDGNSYDPDNTCELIVLLLM